MRFSGPEWRRELGADRFGSFRAMVRAREGGLRTSDRF